MKILHFIHVKKSLILRAFLILSLFLIFISITIFSYSSTIVNNISDSVFRLHVIANSDSKEDQDLKLKVRDNLINYMNSICSNTSSKKEAMNIAREHIADFEKIAKNTIIESGFTYPVTVTIEKSSFPTKYYGDIVLPTGCYDSLNVKIGDASGQNWWCVMFPPLCFVDINSGVVPEESKESLKQSLNEEEYEIINVNSSSDITYKFKILEIAQNIKNKIIK